MAVAIAEVMSVAFGVQPHERLAGGDQIVAIPTLVRKLPEPLRRIIGDLSDTERMIVGLDLKHHVKH